MCLNVEEDSAAFREFQCIADQVEQDLPDAACVARIGRHRQIRDARGDVQSGGMGARAEQFHDFTAKTNRAKRFGFQLDRRGIQTRIVEHIVEKIEQTGPAEPDGFRIFPLRWLQFGFEQ